MTDKSYVTLEQHVCPACGEAHDTGNLLLDKRLRDRFDHMTVTGMSLCNECQQYHEDDYLTLIGIDPERSELNKDGSINLENAHRTGELARIQRRVVRELFDLDEDVIAQPFVFTEQELIDRLKRMANVEDEAAGTNSPS